MLCNLLFFVANLMQLSMHGFVNVYVYCMQLIQTKWEYRIVKKTCKNRNTWLKILRCMTVLTFCSVCECPLFAYQLQYACVLFAFSASLFLTPSLSSLPPRRFSSQIRSQQVFNLQEEWNVVLNSLWHRCLERIFEWRWCHGRCHPNT